MTHSIAYNWALTHGSDDFDARAFGFWAQSHSFTLSQLPEAYDAWTEVDQ